MMGAGIDVDDDQQEPYPDWGPVFLSAASKAILLYWYRKAQRLRASRKGRKERTVKHISDDEGDEKTAEWTKQVGKLSESTKAIAIKWLRTARARLQKKAGKGGDIVSASNSGVVRDSYKVRKEES